MEEDKRKEVRQTFRKILDTLDIDFKRTTIEDLEGILIKIKRLAEHEYHYRLYSNKD
jgi:hypothetical protein